MPCSRFKPPSLRQRKHSDWHFTYLTAFSVIMKASMVYCPENLWNQYNWEHQKKPHTLLGRERPWDSSKGRCIDSAYVGTISQGPFQTQPLLRAAPCPGVLEPWLLPQGLRVQPGALTAPDPQQTQQLCTPPLPALCRAMLPIFPHWWDSSGLQVLPPLSHTPSPPANVLGIINHAWENKKQTFLIPSCSFHP